MRRIVLIAVLAVVIALAGCGGSAKSKQPIDANKQALLDQIERKYESPAAHYQLGKLYHLDGLYEKAEWEYRVAIGFDPVLYPAQAAVVKVLMDMKNTQKSKIAAEMYLDQAAVSAEASLKLGRAFQNEGLDEYALAAYQQAANLAPNSAIAFKQLGFYYLAKGDKAKAEENLRRSIQLDPYQPDVAGELGRMGVIIQIPRRVENPEKLENAVEDIR